MIGKRIKLIKMIDDPNPLPSGSMGTIRHVGGGVINVDWDCGRSLGLIDCFDEYEILD
jgi:hypothetical protein